MITGLTFGHGYHKIRCESPQQAKKLLAEMRASLKHIDAVKGSRSDEIMFHPMQGAKETDEVLGYLKEASGAKLNTICDAINSYKKFPKNPTKPKIDISL